MSCLCGIQADQAAEASGRGGCPANTAFGAEPSVMSSRSECVFLLKLRVAAGSQGNIATPRAFGRTSRPSPMPSHAAQILIRYLVFEPFPTVLETAFPQDWRKDTWIWMLFMVETLDSKFTHRASDSNKRSPSTVVGKGEHVR